MTLPDTMNAAVIDALGSLPAMRRVPVPQPQEGEVLIRVDSSGICHTDVHLSADETSADEDVPDFPLIPGHEGAGTVVAVGPGVTDPAIGDRVVIGWLGYACGDCAECRSGNENLCRQQRNPGNSDDGTLAEYAIGWARGAVKIPEGLATREAGPLACAGVAAFAGVRKAQITPGDLVAVVGVGGLGHLAVQYAALAGARVAAIDLSDERLALARELGAELVVNPATDDPVARLTDLGGAHSVLMFAWSAAALDQGVRCLRPTGRLVQLGWPIDDPVPVPLSVVLTGGLTIVGCDGGTTLDLRRVLELHAAHRIRLLFEERPLDAVAQAFTDLIDGSAAQPRIVLVP